MKSRKSTILCMLIAAALLLSCVGAVYAESVATLDFLEVMVSTEGTTVLINVASEFTYTEDIENHEILITFENTRVNLLGKDFTRIPSFSPLFQSMELTSDRSNDTSVLRIKLANPSVKPEISITPSIKLLAFSFFATGEDILVAKEPVTIFESVEPVIEPVEMIAEVETPAEIEQPVIAPRVSQFKMPAKHEPVVEIPKIVPDDEPEIIEPEVAVAEMKPVIEPDEISEPVIEIEVNEIPAVEESDNQSIEIPVYPEPEIISFEPDVSTEAFPQAKLQAIHYSQGRIDRDVLTLEFADNSPVFNYSFSDAGDVILTLHNVEVPDSILPTDSVKREVMGTLIRSIALLKFDEMGFNSLTIILAGTSKLDMELTDFEGMIDITLRASEE